MPTHNVDKKTTVDGKPVMDLTAVLRKIESGGEQVARVFEHGDHYTVITRTGTKLETR
jgi:hypothetical protein